MDNVDQFIEQLLKDKGISGLDEDVHRQLVHDLGDRLSQFLNHRLIEALPEDKLPEFERLLDEDSSTQDIQEFMAKNIPNVTQVTADSMLEFRALYLGADA